MKAIAGVVAAGALAGAVAVSTGALGGRAGGRSSAGLEPPGAVPAVKPVGPQAVREEVFEFTQKPAVKKQGGKYLITFASKGRCDATVAIVDRDGHVVRHLASGVLGANAPEPLQKGTLAQKIEWDGRDDAGKPVSAGCKVRLGLGLKFTFERNIGYDPGALPGVMGLATGPDGTLYTFQGAQVRAFDSEGEYLRTVIPWPSGLKPEQQMSGHRLLKTTYGDSVVEAGWQGALGPFGLAGSGVVSPDGKKLLIPSGSEGRGRGFIIVGTDGSFTRGSRLDMGCGVHMAVSPDGVVYFGGKGGIVKKGFAELKGPERTTRRTKPAALDAFAKAGEAGQVAALACDKAGNVYAADTAGGRVQVFSPAGKLTKSIPTSKGPKPAKPKSGFLDAAPRAVAVSRHTGAVYCVTVSRASKWSQITAKLVKFGSVTDPTVKAAFDLGTFPSNVRFPQAGGPRFSLAVDAKAEPPVVWLSRGGGALRVEDGGGAFKKLGEIAAPDLFLQVEPGMHRMVVDRGREELYDSWEGRVREGHWYRFDGKTGKRDTTLKDFGASELALGPDDLLYARVGWMGRRLVRFDRNYKIVDFPKGKKLELPRTTAWIVKQNPKCLDTGSAGSNVWTEDIDVAPNGDIWVVGHFVDKDWLAKNVPWRAAGKGRGHGIVQVYAPDGALKSIDAVADSLSTTGIRVDRDGNLYLGVLNPVDKAFGTKKWPGLAKGQSPGDFRAWGKGPGAVVKFAAREDGKWPIGRRNGNSYEGMLWHYDGLSGVTGHSCGCAQKRWDMDDFSRLFLPLNQLYSIMAVDSNGNTIARIGKWGNVDSDKKGEIGFVTIKAIAASDTALYVADQGNRRILKAALSYEAQEELPVP